MTAVLSDFDGDGKSDILWHTTGHFYVEWQMNGGTTSAQQTLGTIPSYWRVEATGDFDGDGKAETLWHNINDGTTELDDIANSALVYKGTSGRINSTFSVAAIGDFDGDGKSDILWKGLDASYTAWFMNGPVVASEKGLGSPSINWRVAGAADFNSDGKAEVVRQNVYSNVIELDSIGASGFTAVATIGSIDKSWSVAAIGDFNGDGKTDILWQSTSHTYSEWLMNGTAVTSQINLGSVPSYWTITGYGDYNGDGRTDILWQHTNGTIEVDSLTPSGWVYQGVPGYLDSSWSNKQILPTKVRGDVDGDRKTDLLWVSTAGQEKLLYMDGVTPTLNYMQNGNGDADGDSIYSNWKVEGYGDFSGNGISDILVHHTDTGAIELNQVNPFVVARGTNSYTSAGTLGTMDNTWTVAAIGDFSGDGKSDILWKKTSSNFYAEWIVDGSLVTSQNMLGTIPSDWKVEGSGDFDGDTRKEIVFHNTNTGAVEIDALGVSGLSLMGTIGNMDSTWSVAAVGDFSGDGKSDILWKNSSNFFVEWRMNGTTVEATQSLGTIPSAWHVVGVGDFFDTGQDQLVMNNGTYTEIDSLTSTGLGFLGNFTTGNFAANWSMVTGG